MQLRSLRLQPSEVLLTSIDLALEIGEAEQDSATATTGPNLSNLVWRALPAYERRIILAPTTTQQEAAQHQGTRRHQPPGERLGAQCHREHGGQRA